MATALDDYFAIIEHELDYGWDALEMAFADILSQRGVDSPWLLHDLMAAVRRELLDMPKE